MTILTANVTNVLIGSLEIEGLMGNDQEFYVAVPQVCSLFSILIKNASRDFKALLGNDFTFLKANTKLHSGAVNCLTLKEFSQLTLELDRKGNRQAREFNNVLIGLSLHQLFCDAFKIKFDEEDRQAWLKNRQFTKETFWFLGDSIKTYYDKNPRREAYPGQNYAEVFDRMNSALFLKKAKQIKEELGIGKNSLNRDHFGEKSLKKIEILQRVAEAQMSHFGKAPMEATCIAINMMRYASSDYSE